MQVRYQRKNGRQVSHQQPMSDRDAVGMAVGGDSRGVVNENNI